jgi:hypothetical protein
MPTGWSRWQAAAYISGILRGKRLIARFSGCGKVAVIGVA